MYGGHAEKMSRRISNSFDLSFLPRNGMSRRFKVLVLSLANHGVSWSPRQENSAEDILGFDRPWSFMVLYSSLASVYCNRSWNFMTMHETWMVMKLVHETFFCFMDGHETCSMDGQSTSSKAGGHGMDGVSWLQIDDRKKTTLIFLSQGHPWT